jgi:hypothetical protein
VAKIVLRKSLMQQIFISKCFVATIASDVQRHLREHVLRFGTSNFCLKMRCSVRVTRERTCRRSASSRPASLSQNTNALYVHTFLCLATLVCEHLQVNVLVLRPAQLLSWRGSYQMLRHRSTSVLKPHCVVCTYNLYALHIHEFTCTCQLTNLIAHTHPRARTHAWIQTYRTYVRSGVRTYTQASMHTHT